MNIDFEKPQPTHEEKAMIDTLTSVRENLVGLDTKLSVLNMVRQFRQRKQAQGGSYIGDFSLVDERKRYLYKNILEPLTGTFLRMADAAGMAPRMLEQVTLYPVLAENLRITYPRLARKNCEKGNFVSDLKAVFKRNQPLAYAFTSLDKTLEHCAMLGQEIFEATKKRHRKSFYKEGHGTHISEARVYLDMAIQKLPEIKLVSALRIYEQTQPRSKVTDRVLN